MGRGRSGGGDGRGDVEGASVKKGYIEYDKGRKRMTCTNTPGSSVATFLIACSLPIDAPPNSWVLLHYL